MNLEKKIKQTEELHSVLKEKDKVKYWLNIGNTCELEKCLHEIRQKYPTEMILYNAINTKQPVSLQENAENCMRFLDSIYMKKSSEIAQQ